MRRRINPWWFLVRLVVLLVATYFLWAPLAPAYAQFLLRASQVGIWLTELTSEPAPQEDDRLMGSPEQLTVALRAYRRIGVEHMALQFMVPRWPERRHQIERFAAEVMPAIHDR